MFECVGGEDEEGSSDDHEESRDPNETREEQQRSPIESRIKCGGPEDPEIREFNRSQHPQTMRDVDKGCIRRLESVGRVGEGVGCGADEVLESKFSQCLGVAKVHLGGSHGGIRVGRSHHSTLASYRSSALDTTRR